LKNDEVIDFLTLPPTDFSALKMFKLYNIYTRYNIMYRIHVA